MPVSQPDLDIDVSVITGCTGLTLTDNTGEYPAAPFGYGMASGPALNDITENVVVLTYSSMNTTAEYVFTIDEGEITDATLSLGGVTPVDIFDSLDSTVWPLNNFILTGDYGVALPTFVDDVFKIEYTISGTSDGDDFEFTAVVYEPVGCNLLCCIRKKFQALDPSCGCSDDATKEANYVLAQYNKFIYSCEDGNLADALTALMEGQAKCDNEGGCGC